MARLPALKEFQKFPKEKKTDGKEKLFSAVKWDQQEDNI